MLYKFVYHFIAPFVVFPFLKLFNRLKIVGLEHIPAEGATVIVANHISMWDPVILYCVLRRRTWFMGKAELFSIPVIGFILRRISVFPVKRDTIDRDALRKASQVLEEGHILVLFPEGHRGKPGEMLPFKQGAALFAHRAGAAVIPMFFENTPKIFPKSIGQRINVTVGAPLNLCAYRGTKANSALLADMTNDFRAAIEQLKEVV